MVHYSTQEEIHILNQMIKLSDALKQFELLGLEDNSQYKKYLSMLEELEVHLIKLRDLSDKNN